MDLKLEFRSVNPSPFSGFHEVGARYILVNERNNGQVRTLDEVLDLHVRITESREELGQRLLVHGISVPKLHDLHLLVASDRGRGFLKATIIIFKRSRPAKSPN